MKTAVWALIGGALVVSFVIGGMFVIKNQGAFGNQVNPDSNELTEDNSYPDTILIYIDRSASGDELQMLLDKLLFQFIGRLQRDYHFIIYRYVHDAPVLVMETNHNPTPDELATLADELRIREEEGTKQLDVIAHAQNYCTTHSEDTAIVIFTDGQNDYYDDEAPLNETCQLLASNSQVYAITMFGLDPETTDKWKNRFLGATSTCVIANRLSSDQAINQFTDQL